MSAFYLKHIMRKFPYVIGLIEMFFNGRILTTFHLHRVTYITHMITMLTGCSFSNKPVFKTSFTC